MRGKTQDTGRKTQGRWVWVAAVFVCVIMLRGEGMACEVYDVDLWVGATVADAEAHNTSAVEVCRPDIFGWHIEWDAYTPDNAGFDIRVKDLTSSQTLQIHPNDDDAGATARDQSGPAWWYPMVPGAAKTIRAEVRRSGTIWCASNSRTVTVIEVVDVTVSTDVEAMNTDVTFTVVTSPSGHYDLIQWSGGGTPSSDCCGQTFTTQWPSGGVKTVTASCGGHSCIGCYDTNSVTIFQIAQNHNLWWFDGENPGGGYVVQATLTAFPVPAPSGTYKWDVTAGTSKVDLNNGGSDSDTITATNDNDVVIKSTAASASAGSVTNDVTVQLKYDSEVVATLDTVVFAPDHLVHHGDYDYAAGAGWLSTIYYRIEDQFNQTLPYIVPINEEFTTGETSDWPGGDNWVRGPAGGGSVSPASWNDNFQRADPANTIPTMQNPQSPLGNEKVDHFDGNWLVGSATVGNGRSVISVTWQSYRDHGRHE